MLPDISDLSFAEKQDLVFKVVTEWLGPIEIPNFADGKKGLGIFPLEAQVRYGERQHVGGYVNAPFKPFRIVVLETTYAREEHTPRVVVPAVTKKTWWGRGKEKVVEPERVVSEAKSITHLETIPRNRWSIGSIFIGDLPQLLGGGRDVNGDAFAPDKTCDYDFTTAQTGMQVAMTVGHCVPGATLTFRVIILGTKMRYSEEWQEPPRLESLR
jgi:hypothetical protein